MQLGNEQAVKAEGKYVQKGKDYVVEDGDIIYMCGSDQMKCQTHRVFCKIRRSLLVSP